MKELEGFLQLHSPPSPPHHSRSTTWICSFQHTLSALTDAKTRSACAQDGSCHVISRWIRAQDYPHPWVCFGRALPSSYTVCSLHVSPCRVVTPLVETKKQPALLKADAMKAAAGVFFGTYAGFAVACRKLSLGDPKKATLTQRQLLTHSTLGAFPRRVSSLSVGPSLTMMASQRLRPRRWQSGRRMKRCWQTKKTRRARSGRS